MTNALGTRLPALTQDLVLLLARIGLGVVLIAHGWQKLDQNGLDATASGFESMGVPAPAAAAVFATGVELVGGALLVVGLLTRVVGVLVAADMAGAFWYAHREAGVFVAEGGWELVVVIGLLGLVLLATGPGRISVDHAVLAGRRRARRSPSTDDRRVAAGSPAGEDVLSR